MYKISARKLLCIPSEVLLNKIKGSFEVIFDNNETIILTSKEIYFSSFFWEYHKRYNKMQLLPRHYIGKYISDGNRLSPGTLLRLLEVIIFDVFDCYKHEISGNDHLLFMDDLSKLGYEVINSLYNDLSNKISRYARSLDILDFLSITQHKEIKSYRENNLQLTSESVYEFTNLIKRLFKEDSTIKNNTLVKSINCGEVKLSQALQCVGARGYVTDIDSNLFKYPILSNFTLGLKNMYEVMIESRSASKSLIYSKSQLQESSYFDRRQQLIVQIVNKIYIGDCGSKKYLNWLVRDVKYSGNTKINDCDLNTLVGKYYLDEQTNDLKIIKKSDRHLIGKYIKLRSPIAGCGKPVCSVCYGDNYTSVTRFSNLGHLIMSNLGSKMSQGILSTKHDDGNNDIEGIVLDEFNSQYLSSTLNGSNYYLNERLKQYSVKLVVSSDNAFGLIDIEKTDKLEKLSLPKISNFENIKLIIDKNNSEIEEPQLDVFVNDRLSSFSHQMLYFIKNKGWVIDDKNNYIIDLTDWDYSLPILVVPDRHYNMSQTQKDLASFIESKMSKKDLSPEEALITLVDIVNKRFNIPLSNIEVILLASMWVNPSNNNYNIPTDNTEKSLGNKSSIYANRSLSAVLSFQEHKKAFNRPKNYLFIDRVDHPVCDSIMMPSLLNAKYKI